jgi:hypothetical protein
MQRVPLPGYFQVGHRLALIEMKRRRKLATAGYAAYAPLRQDEFIDKATVPATCLRCGKAANSEADIVQHVKKDHYKLRNVQVKKQCTIF